MLFLDDYHSSSISRADMLEVLTEKELEQYDIFDDDIFRTKIQDRLPKYIHDLNNTFAKDGKLSPDIGTLREKMIIGIFKKHFGDNFSDKLPPQEAEADFIIFGENLIFTNLSSW